MIFMRDRDQGKDIMHCEHTDPCHNGVKCFNSEELLAFVEEMLNTAIYVQNISNRILLPFPQQEGDLLLVMFWMAARNR